MPRLIAIATVPVILILFYVYYRDKYKKGPIWMLLLSLAGGAAIVPVVMWWEQAMSGLAAYYYSFQWQHAFIVSFLVAGLCEESMKLLAFMLLIWRRSYFMKKFDAILYAVYISLGFALVENIMYVIAGGTQTGFTRALTAVPAHAIFGIAMGFYLGRAKFSSRKRFFKIFYALFVPLVLHGTYNYIIMADMPYLLFTFVLYVILLYLLGFKKLKTINNASVFRPVRKKFRDY
ncbi:MAG: PrsW family intramembrane metalloprotease [Bacteroidota bacterium]|nr:PrsW family intramembrane metalloprotease [Bacteroidota bacterium]